MKGIPHIPGWMAWALMVVAVAAAGDCAWAQETKGPIGPPPKFEAKRESNVPAPAPPPVPENEIIKRFTANEDVMKKEFDAYEFKETIHLEEMTDPGGKFLAVGEVYTRPDGQRILRVTKPPESDLKLTAFSLEDVRTIASLPLFPLTTEEIGNYNLKYAGTDKLDELNTYVFQVKPKQLSRTRRFFEGAVWVDDKDFVIVKSFGQFESEIAGEGSKLPFKMFEVFRENFQDKYWLPTYTRSEDTIPGPHGLQIDLRLIVRASEFKLSTPEPASQSTPAQKSAPTAAPAPTSSPPKPPN
jgi:hypothetical protein